MKRQETDLLHPVRETACRRSLRHLTMKCLVESEISRML